MKRLRPYALLALMVLLLLGGLLGCAAGRGPGGEVVVGFDVAKLPETANESIVALGDMLIPGLGLAGAGIITPIAVAIRNSAKRRSAEVAAATLAGKEAGWTEREQAAGIQQPLDASPLPAGVGAGVPAAHATV